jgi:hypothetical protein
MKTGIIHTIEGGGQRGVCSPPYPLCGNGGLVHPPSPEDMDKSLSMGLSVPLSRETGRCMTESAHRSRDDANPDETLGSLTPAMPARPMHSPQAGRSDSGPSHGSLARPIAAQRGCNRLAAACRGDPCPAGEDDQSFASDHSICNKSSVKSDHFTTRDLLVLSIC